MTDVRPMAEGEQGAFARSASIPFLAHGDQDAPAHWQAHLEVGRTWVAEDRGRIVGQCCTFTRDVTVPGPAGGLCPAVAMTAVSGVGVHPTHRRQGLLTTMMATMLEDGRGRGEPFATLLASESVIYGRYGFGPAVSWSKTRIDTRHAAFRADASPAPRRVDLLETGEAAGVLPSLADRCRRRRAGDVSRNDATWSDTWADRPGRRREMSALHYAVSDDAFAVYRTAEGHGGQPSHARVEMLYGETAEAEAAMFAWLSGLDLVNRLELGVRPVDDPIRWRLADPRRLETTWLGDFLWVRILDTPASLTARSYHGTGRLVLDLVGDPDPAVGRWVLEAGPDGSACVPARAGDATDLCLGLSELGALYLGGVSASVLHLAGRIDERRRGALAVADRLFTTAVAPFSGTGF